MLLLTLIAIQIIFSLDNLQANSIVEHNPFVWSDFKAPSQVEASSVSKQSNPLGYEFSGVYSIDNKYFVLFGEKRVSSRWYRVPSEIDNVNIREYNPIEGTLLIEENEKKITLQMRELSGNSTPIPVAGNNISSGNGSINTSRGDTTTTVRRPTTSRRVVRPRSSTSSRASESSRLRAPIRPKQNEIQVSENEIKRLNAFEVPPLQNPNPPKLGDLKVPENVNLPTEIGK